VEAALKKLTKQIVLVDGATGYLGNHVVDALLTKGAHVRALVRPQASAADIAYLQSIGATIFQADLLNFENSAGQRRKLEEAFSGITSAVHLIGSVAPARGEKFAQLHGEQSRAFASWCVRAKDVDGGFSRACAVTSLGANLDAPSEYLRSKREAELALLAELDGAQISSTIFRPSLIVGRKVGRRDSKLVKRYRHLAKTRKIVPLINGGNNLLQPVFVCDLAEAIAEKIFAGANNQSDICEIGGARVLSMKEIVLAIMAALDLKKPFFNIPSGVALAAASVMQRWQDVPLISKDQAIMAGFDNICQDNRLAEIIKRPPTDLSVALATYRNWEN